MNKSGKIKKRIPWNKGLTKDTDERVKKYSETLTSERRSKIVEKSHKKMSEQDKQKRANNISKGRKGMKFSEEHKKNIGESKIGFVPWNKNTKGLMVKNVGSFKKGHKIAKEISNKIIKTRRENGWFKNLDKTRILKSRENHWNWKGGVTPLVNKIRGSLEIKLWRKAVFERDNFTCQDCNKCGGNLEAHHKKEFSIIFKENNIKTFEQAKQCKELWNINNGQTLCVDCHNLTKKGRKKKDDKK